MRVTTVKVLEQLASQPAAVINYSCHLAHTAQHCKPGTVFNTVITLPKLPQKPFSVNVL